MANIYGKEMKKADILRYAGNIDQIAGIRHEEILDDRARGIKVYNVNNSVIEYTLTESKALDIFDFKYKGIGLCFKSKAGLVMPGTLDANGWNFLRGQCSGGLIYSCGFSNVGLFGENPKWHDYDMFHGRLRTLPATNLCAKTYWEGDDYYLTVSGEMRECALFKDNLAIRREIKTKLGSKSFSFCTEVENEAFDEAPIMHMLHVNSGFPIVDKDSRFICKVNKTHCMCDAADADNFRTMSAPIDNKPEEVFVHEPYSNEDGICASAIVNDKTGLGLMIKFKVEQFPYLLEWKSMGSGDYVLGMQPTNCFASGTEYELKANGKLPMIQPGEIKHFDLEVTVLDGKEDILKAEEFINSLSIIKK